MGTQSLLPFQGMNNPLTGSGGFPAQGFPNQLNQFGNNSFPGIGTFPFAAGVPFGFAGAGYPGAGSFGGSAVGTGSPQAMIGNGGAFGTVPGSDAASTAVRSSARPASITIRVPEQADVSIQGQKLNQIGSVRQFITPVLDAGAVQTYLIRATWKQGGTEMAASEEVFVMPGDQKSVLFLSGRPVQQTQSSR